MLLTLKSCDEVVVTCFGPSMGREMYFAACHRQPDGSDLIEKHHILPGVNVNNPPPGRITQRKSHPVGYITLTSKGELLIRLFELL